MPHSQDPEAWTIPSMNEVPTWPVALLIRGWGTDARTGINSRVDVLGDRARSYCTCSSIKKDSMAGVEGGRAEGRSKF